MTARYLQAAAGASHRCEPDRAPLENASLIDDLQADRDGSEADDDQVAAAGLLLLHPIEGHVGGLQHC